MTLDTIKAPMHAYPNKIHLAAAIVAIASAAASMTAHAADPQRQAEVAERGKEVMPFRLDATSHVFTKTPDGGIQRVIAKTATDTAQVTLVRQHLQDIRLQFLKGDFSGPSHIHGRQMPGLAELERAMPGQIAIGYSDVPGGGELVYQTSDDKLVTALHRWFDAQVSDHGPDAIEGHSEHMHHKTR
jgi:hypothetical protein